MDRLVTRSGLSSKGLFNWKFVEPCQCSQLHGAKPRWQYNNNWTFPAYSKTVHFLLIALWKEWLRNFYMYCHDNRDSYLLSLLYFLWCGFMVSWYLLAIFVYNHSSSVVGLRLRDCNFTKIEKWYWWGIFGESHFQVSLTA